jgi:hypothetical protein
MDTAAALPAHHRRPWFLDDRWLLPIEGLVSGALTSVAPGLASPFRPALLVVFAGSGAIFGGIIACHFRLFRGVRSANTLAGFAGICAAAYVVSVIATLEIPFHPAALNSFVGLGAVCGGIIGCYFWLFRSPRSADGLAGLAGACALTLVVCVFATIKTHFASEAGGGGILDPAKSAFFSGGMVGAAIVCGGVFFLFAPATTNVGMFFAKALVISVAGGYLGILGWGLGDRWPANYSVYTLYIVWQAGTAGLVAFLLPRETTSLPVIARTRPPVPARMNSAREEYEGRVARP